MGEPGVARRRQLEILLAALVATFCTHFQSAMAQVSGLTATPLSSSAIELQWSGSSAYAEYRILRDGVEIATTPATTFADGGLFPLTTYAYSVIGVAASATAVATTSPQNEILLTAAALLASEASLTWTATGSYAEFRVFRDGVEIAATSSTAYSDTSLTPSTSYAYRIEGLATDGTVVVSNTATIMTPPLASIELSATPASPTSTALAWTAVGSFTEFEVLRDDSRIAVTTAPNFLDTGVSPATNYSYQIIGSMTAGGAVASNVATATTPPQSSISLTAMATSPTTATLAWTAVGSYSSFEVFRNGISVGATTELTFADAGLAPATSFGYHVVGAAISGGPTTSNTASVTTPAQTLITLAAMLDPGARSFMMVRDAAFDAAGNIYLTGGAFSSQFPTTPGAYDTTFATGGASLGADGPSDVFVMKFTPQGQLIWSTLLGGPNYDRAYAIELAADGGVIVAGRAGDQFPTTPGAVQTAFSGDTQPLYPYGLQDGFIAKISADGAALLWSTYVGDSSFSFVRDIDLDAQDRIHFVSVMRANSPFVTPNAFQRLARGPVDLVYARLNPTASVLEYGTYFGGAERVGAKRGNPSIRVTPNNEVYVLTLENSTGAPTTATAFQRANTGLHDLLVGKFNAQGQLVYGTYLGGSGEELIETHNLDVDAQGRAIVTAITKSGNFPTTAGAFQTAFGGGVWDGVVAVISTDGATLVGSTYFGGAGDEDLQGVVAADDGRAFIAGGSTSGTLPATPDAFQRSFAGVKDAIIAAFPVDLSAPSYLTYFGGNGEDLIRSLDKGNDGKIVFGGQASSTNLSVSAGGSTAPPVGKFSGFFGIIVP
jgi:hypothetical protein